MKKILLSIGYGYCAQDFVKNLPRNEWKIIVTTRSEAKALELTAQGLSVAVWPKTDLTPYIKQATHILSSVAPNEAGDPVLNEYKKVLKQFSKNLNWVGYLSTTGVYGDHDGGWVDETTKTTPSTRRGQLRVLAEKSWLDIGLPLHIFRLAGIYGPNRGPFVKLRSGTARCLVKKNQVFSRIHVEDITKTLLASINNPTKCGIYNVCDDMAAAPQDVIIYAAKLLNIAPPEFEDFKTAKMNLLARSFYSESKKVSNCKIKDELGVILSYPNYKLGLKSLL